MDVVDRIKSEISSRPVVLFMKGSPDFPQCGFSAQAVAALRACGAELTHVDIFEDPERRDAIRRAAAAQASILGSLLTGSAAGTASQPSAHARSSARA